MQMPVLLYHLFEQQVLAVLITIPRLASFLAASQLLTAGSAPRMARQAIVLVLAGAMSPINLAYINEVPREVPAFALLFFKEWCFGFLMGYGVAWLFWSMQAAGGIIDNQRGAAIASSIDPLQGHESSPIGNLFSQAFITYFFASGGFLMILGLFMHSYNAWPVTNFFPLPPFALVELSTGIMDLGMRLMLVLAAPILVIMFVSEFALALVSRFAPQVQVFILAMPIKSALAIVMLIFYFHTLFEVAVGESARLEAYLEEFYRLLSPTLRSNGEDG
ncbi:MAG: type III secretion system export apparatus subunit SctT [Pseudomonadota bacterium]